MKIPFIKTACLAVLTLSLSSVALANHPVKAAVEIDGESLNRIRLSQVKLRHDDDGQYRLSGNVRRQQKMPVPMGHFDLVASDWQGATVYEDSEYYWPRAVNRRYKYPSKFVFVLPEDAVNSTTLTLSFHRNKSTNKPKPLH